MSNLKLNLKKVDPVKYGVITGLLMALLTFVIFLIMFLFTSLIGVSMADDAFGAGAILGGGVVMIVVGPIIYFIFGFVFGLIGAFLLNVILKRTNGLTMEFEKIGLDIQEIGKE